MTYIDGFIIPVPSAGQAGFIDHAERMDRIFLDHGATAIVEGWADDVPDGTVTDFRKAVQATSDETVAFSWIAWPDKATRDAAFKAMEADEAMMAEPMPFDGKRMIYGGFAPLLERRFGDARPGYIDGIVLAVPAGKKDAYANMAADAAEKFASYGALFDVEGWGDDVKDGTRTDFRRAVQAQEGEVVVFSFLGWPDKATRDAGWGKMMEAGPPPGEVPFDGKRMFWGGFRPVVQLEK